jgi:cation diffusion facilitator family transporter
MSASGGTRAIVAALAANLGIAATKFIAWALTFSSSMLAESIHSVADSGNQILLLIGGKRSQRDATPQHPFGYGRERYVYAFIVSVVLFSVGGLFALYEGYHKLRHPEPIESWHWVPVVVLVVAIGLESFSFKTAIAESNQVRGRTSWKDFVRRAKAPELPVVLLEDTAALVGLVFALFGVGLTLLTDNGVWDGIGTVAIGLLLVAVAVFLAAETKSLLLGEAATADDVRAIEKALLAGDGTGAGVERIIHMKTMHLGPDELLVAAKIAVRHDDTAGEVARGIDEAEARIRAAVPIARVIYLEPDIYHAQSNPAAPAGTAATPAGNPAAAGNAATPAGNPAAAGNAATPAGKSAAPSTAATVPGGAPAAPADGADHAS